MLLWSMGMPLPAQENKKKPVIHYTVLAPQGKIQTLKKKKELRPGMHLTSEQELKFFSREAEACLIDDEGQRYHLCGQYLPDSVLVGKISKALDYYPNRAIRCCMSEKDDLPSISQFIQASHPQVVVLGDSLLLDVSSFAQYDTYFVRFFYQTQEVKKKLPRLADTLFLIKNEMYTLPLHDSPDMLLSDPILVNTIELFGQEKKDRGRGASHIKSFQLDFIKPKQIKPTFAALHKHYSLMLHPPQKIKFEYFDFFGEVYGFTDLYKLERWLRHEGFLE